MSKSYHELWNEASEKEIFTKSKSVLQALSNYQQTCWLSRIKLKLIKLIGGK
jgi:hypothetical protein